MGDDEAIHWLGLPKKHINDHRKWSWADEQGWIRVIRIPLCEQYGWSKYAGNPILEATPGEWDSINVVNPCVVYKDGKYWLFYQGDTGVPNTEAIGVAYATSPEGPYTKSASNPILTKEGVGWEKDGIYGCSVMYDEIDSVWKMWYLGYSGAVAQIGYATASDPEGPWTKSGANPVYGVDVYRGVSCIRLGNLYWLAFGSTAGVGVLITSGDGLAWTLYGTICPKGDADEWDDNAVRYAGVFWNLGITYYFYAGHDGANFRIGLTESWNCFAFTKFQRNPVLNVGAGGSWEDLHVFNPSVLMVGKKYYMWYSGWKVAGNVRAIGLASIP